MDGMVLDNSFMDVLPSGRFTTSAVSKWPNYLFETLFGFKTAGLFQNLTYQSYLSYDLE